MLKMVKRFFADLDIPRDRMHGPSIALCNTETISGFSELTAPYTPKQRSPLKSNIKRAVKLCPRKDYEYRNSTQTSTYM